MNIKELKIGSLVLENVKGNCYEQVVEELTLTEINGQSPEDFKGIPLTSEWLEKSGFTRRDNFAYDFGKLSIILKGDHGYKDGRTYYNSWAILESQPKYVHSLQNLIYTLEGKELIISRK